MDDFHLPAQVKTQLVLLVVDPYLIHAYWEVSPEKFREVKKLAEVAKCLVRFYKGGKTSREEVPPESFDIEIDFQAGNWYVHHWSPAESLYADLALNPADGTLLTLVRSQVVHMPRVRPAIAIG